MTVLALWRVLLARWYVVLIGLACTTAAFLALDDSPRVYSAQTDVLFVLPGNVGIRGLNDGFAETLINFTGLVGEKVNEGRTSLKLSSPSAPLFGTGVREGASISLVDAGGQWQRSFNRPVISVQVVDSSPENVESVMKGIVQDISRTAENVQAESGTDASKYITIETAPESIEITSFGATRMSTAKGLIALTIVGGGLTIGTAVYLDRRVANRRNRQGRSHVPAE
ncbi:hypothetical protein [Mycetocola zhadangensis]|uniref:Uncharacterized protein n=1 Tax=Mycetocola zhadangensis TaxID=1164595 RepID=A0A3L7J2R4_9MICO|nr:hypothetical protein [Mycetocola zhadangensis]RLQ84575.1 hypothetical protein D9V28_10445 [Mycetocola zhadangensis]GGE91739.1 hypothetical protein GCM10011313_13290 [Mycetocola zhadangensis]